MTEFKLIRNWAKERGIYDKGDVKTQLIKLYEETGELSEAILKDNEEEFVDAIGDAVVVLTNLSTLAVSTLSIVSIVHMARSVIELEIW